MPVEITRRRFDVDAYHRMAETGILSEDDRVELIDGEIVTMTPTGPRHNAAVNRANRVLVTTVGDRAIAQVQGPVRLDRFREVQPDLALLTPRSDFYASRLPGPADVLLLVDIGESSIDYDRQMKARIYAESGVPEYWVVDLAARVVSRHTEPHEGVYRRVRQHQSGETLAPERLPECAIQTGVLLID